MSINKEYSIWLMPTADVYDNLNSRISLLSKKYDMPYFEPHVTLIGSILGCDSEIISKTFDLAQVIKKQN